MLAEIESSPAPSVERLRVGGWLVEPALNQISAGGKTVKLEPKSMSVLAYLAERPKQVVTRDALLSALWPGVVVGDDSLTQVVVKLRRALGDTSEEPTYIQTISKSGYRLIAPVLRSGAPGPSRVLRASDLRLLAAAGAAALLLFAAVAWWMKREPAAPPITAATAETDKPTVYIRPFEALRDDPEAAVLARGITEDLSTDLSKAFELRVIGFTPAVVRTRYLVSGTVERSGSRLRVHAHLADAESGKQLWSERFDRTLAYFFAIQDELAPKIVQKLSASVSKTELERMARRHTRNLEAYEYFQRGQFAAVQRGGTHTARDMYRRAIALDANFARAYAALALTYVTDVRRQQTTDDAASLDRALALARTAQQIDPDVPQTYVVLARVLEHRRQHEQALRYLQTAIKLYPSFADGYAHMASIETHIGRPADAVALVRTAMRLDPEARHLYFLVLGRAYLFLGDLEQARVNLEHALKRNSESTEARIYLAVVYLVAGDKASAGWEAEEIRAIQPGFSRRAWLDVYPMTDAAQKAKLEQSLASLGL
jgi:TolB-like protein/DNA-binding winged helix-turn-helix (wHTH) protein/Flp pilus assembly protein TadD